MAERPCRVPIVPAQGVGRGSVGAADGAESEGVPAAPTPSDRPALRNADAVATRHRRAGPELCRRVRDRQRLIGLLTRSFDATVPNLGRQDRAELLGKPEPSRPKEGSHPAIHRCVRSRPVVLLLAAAPVAADTTGGGAEPISAASQMLDVEYGRSDRHEPRRRPERRRNLVRLSRHLHVRVLGQRPVHVHLRQVRVQPRLGLAGRIRLSVALDTTVMVARTC